METKKFNFHKTYEEKVEAKKALDEVPMIPVEEDFIEPELDEEMEEDLPSVFDELKNDLDLTPEEYMEKHGLPELKNDDVEAAVQEVFSELVFGSECEELIELANDEDLGLREKLEIAAEEYEEVIDEETPEELIDEEIEVVDEEPKAEDEAIDAEVPGEEKAYDSFDEEKFATDSGVDVQELKDRRARQKEKGWDDEKIDAYLTALYSKAE